MSVPRQRRPAPPARRARSRGRRNRTSDLTARFVSAIPLVALAIGLVVAGGAVFAVGMFVLGAICLRELFTMFDRTNPVIFGAFAALAGLIVAAALGDASNVLLAFMASIPLVFAFGLVQPRRAGAAGIAVTALGLGWIGLAFAHAVLLRDLPHGGAILADVLVATFVGDTGAYLGGRALGRRPLAPSISPNKTVEGLIFGMGAALAAAWFAGLYQDWLSGSDALLIGLGVAIAAPAGDLFESFVKRDAGVKDTSAIFGAHGGALDRLDAALFAIVAGFYIWQALL
jgi:phosphatidate cytidylyltransferase